MFDCLFWPELLRSHDRICESRVAGPGRFGWNGRDRGGDDPFGCFRVLLQVVDDHFDGDMSFIGLPAIVIGDHGHRGVGDFGFTRAASFA